MVDFLNETTLSFPVAAESLAGAVQREAKQRQYRVMAGQVAGCRTAAWCCPYGRHPLKLPPRWGDFDVYNICPRLDRTCECRFIFITVFFIYIHSSFSVIIYIISIHIYTILYLYQHQTSNIKHQTSISISIYKLISLYLSIYLF